MFTRSPRSVAIVAALTLAVVPSTVTYASAQDNATSPVVESVETTSPPAEDGRTTFRGLFFGQGPVAHDLVGNKDFAILADNIAANSTPEAFEAADHILDVIATDNPGFFEEFNEDARSGQPHRLATALKDGGTKLIDAGATVTETDVSPNCGLWVFVGAAVVHAAGAVTAAVAAVTVTVVAGANFIYAQNKFFGGKSANTSLSEEESIAGLTKSLSA